jgi:anti-sigma-K factor RskA
VTEPHDNDDLLLLATPYALHAMPQSDLDDIDRQLAHAPAPVALAFADEVRAVRETMALVSASTAAEPPTDLRERLLTAVGGGRVVELRPRSTRRRAAAIAIAAAVAIGLGAAGIGFAIRPEQTQSAAEQIFAAPDVRTVSGDIPTGGTATVMFSRERNAGMLVMNNVAPPKPGTVYQMWLVDAQGPKSAGIMDAAAVAPSTTAVLPDLGDSKTLAFTVEPSGGSTSPTTPIFAALPLA